MKYLATFINLGLKLVYSIYYRSSNKHTQCSDEHFFVESSDFGSQNKDSKMHLDSSYWTYANLRHADKSKHNFTLSIWLW